jgi:hypothetical protein
MRDYLEDIAANFESRPTPTETLRGGVALGKEFSGLSEPIREQLSRSDRTWAVIRAKIAQQTPEARKALADAVTRIGKRDGSRDAAGTLKPEAVFEIVSTASLTSDSPAAYWASRL